MHAYTCRHTTYFYNLYQGSGKLYNKLTINQHTHIYISMHIYIYMCVCMCVCVCLGEREGVRLCAWLLVIYKQIYNPLRMICLCLYKVIICFYGFYQYDNCVCVCVIVCRYFVHILLPILFICINNELSVGEYHPSTIDNFR